MTVRDQQPLNVQAIVDLLSRRQPNVLDQIRKRYPSYAGMLQPGKLLGAGNASQDRLLIDLAVNSSRIAKKECADTFHMVSGRLRTSARLRLGAGIVSSASSGGLVAALMQDAPRVALVAGLLAFISSGFTLMAQYMEEYAGGQNSLREMRDRVVRHIAESTEVEAEVRLMEARGAFEEIEAEIRKLNAVIASVRQVQMAVT